MNVSPLSKLRRPGHLALTHNLLSKCRKSESKLTAKTPMYGMWYIRARRQDRKIAIISAKGVQPYHMQAVKFRAGFSFGSHEN